MIIKDIIYFLPFLFTHIAYAQQVDVVIKADRKYSNNTKDFIFNVQIKNKSFKEYYVQDTAFIQQRALNPAFIWPYIEKKENGKYIPLGRSGHGGASLAPDPCNFECCNCLLLNKGDSLQFNLELLSSYKLDRGEYRVYVLLHPPEAPKKISMNVYTEFKSNYVYFSIK